MTDLFLNILHMNAKASYVILCIMLIRLPLKKAPKVFSYALWSVAAFRLLCPFSFKSIVSLVPKVPRDIAYRQVPQIKGVITAAASYANSPVSAPTPAASADPMQIYIRIGAYVWLAGIAAMLIYNVVSVLILKNRLKSARCAGDNIYEAAGLKTPFVLGLFAPRIFIPEGLRIEERAYIIRHEQTHIRRLDHIVKPFAFMVLSIHWFNPLVWAAFCLMSSDMELSCDERVLEEMGGNIKKAYSLSLLSLAAGGRIINGSPLAFGEGNVKGRIKNVLNYKRPAFKIVAAAVIAVLIAGIGLAADPMITAADEGSYADKLYKYRTQYVGDNSKVMNIASCLPVPDILKYSKVQLFTDDPPYGVEVTYNTTPEAINSFSDKGSQTFFDRDAILMFSLIKNAGYVNFVLTDGNGKLSVGRTREWANSTMGRDLWESSATAEKFDLLYTETEERFLSDYKKQKQPVGLANFVMAENTAVLSDGKNVSVRLVMTGGKYFNEKYAGAGGGIYRENYQGNYEIQVLDSYGKLISAAKFENEGQPANFPGKFELLFDDYNDDKNPDLSIGQYGSSSMNIYRLYTIMPDGSVKDISGETFTHASSDFSVKFKKDGQSGFYTQFYNNAIGKTVTVHYIWDKNDDTFKEDPS